MKRIFLLALLPVCGGRTDLGHRTLESPVDASTDVVVHDVVVLHDARPDVIGAACTQGVLTDSPPDQCGGDQVDWFATPYTPPSDITVHRVEAYMAQGNVALLESSGGAPGNVLFQGSVGTPPMKSWVGADVSPPVFLQGGTLYYIGFQGDCSFAWNGPEPVEYMAPSVSGPWHVQGTDNWTARLIGTCP
jgi:hypothetical protein